MTAHIPAEITFEDFRSGETHTIVGKIPTSQLFDRNTHWITVQNMRRQNRVWIERECYISKEDIHQIIFLEKHSFLSFKHGKTILQSKPLTKVKISQ
jgi:hypothetical protein